MVHVTYWLQVICLALLCKYKLVERCYGLELLVWLGCCLPAHCGTQKLEQGVPKSRAVQTFWCWEPQLIKHSGWHNKTTPACRDYLGKTMQKVKIFIKTQRNIGMFYQNNNLSVAKSCNTIIIVIVIVIIRINYYVCNSLAKCLPNEP